MRKTPGVLGGSTASHRWPFWLFWSNNGGRFLVYLVVQSSTRAIYFPEKDAYAHGPLLDPFEDNV